MTQVDLGVRYGICRFLKPLSFSRVSRFSLKMYIKFNDKTVFFTVKYRYSFCLSAAEYSVAARNVCFDLFKTGVHVNSVSSLQRDTFVCHYSIHFLRGSHFHNFQPVIG